jgi:hypothetical protein
VDSAVIVTAPPLGIAAGAVYFTAVPLDTCAVVEPENEPQLPELLQLRVKSAPPEAMELASVTEKLAVPPTGRVSAVGVMLIREDGIARVVLAVTVESFLSVAVI